jgi:hypothetical protein
MDLDAAVLRTPIRCRIIRNKGTARPDKQVDAACVDALGDQEALYGNATAQQLGSIAP